MKRAVLLLSILLVLTSATPALAWVVGTGSVNVNNDRQFWAYATDPGGVEWFLIEYNARLYNDFEYGSGRQRSYNHQIGGLYKIQDGVMQSFATGSIHYHETGGISFDTYIYRKYDLNLLTKPGWWYYGWGNNTDSAWNYYPGGPDYVESSTMWNGRTAWGQLNPPTDTAYNSHTYR